MSKGDFAGWRMRIYVFGRYNEVSIWRKEMCYIIQSLYHASIIRVISSALWFCCRARVKNFNFSFRLYEYQSLSRTVNAFFFLHVYKQNFNRLRVTSIASELICCIRGVSKSIVSKLVFFSCYMFMTIMTWMRGNNLYNFYSDLYSR